MVVLLFLNGREFNLCVLVTQIEESQLNKYLNRSEDNRGKVRDKHQGRTFFLDVGVIEIYY